MEICAIQRVYKYALKIKDNALKLPLHSHMDVRCINTMKANFFPSCKTFIVIEDGMLRKRKKRENIIYLVKSESPHRKWRTTKYKFKFEYYYHQCTIDGYDG